MNDIEDCPNSDTTPPESSSTGAGSLKRPHLCTTATAHRVLTSTGLLVAIVVLGITLRVAQYAANRALWLDEALLALNVIGRSPRELLGTLDFNQAAPPGFLLLERGMTAFLGYSEPVLRAVPLLSGIGSLIVFAWLARRMLTPVPALFAVLLLSVADGLIYYSSEVKPYSLDVFATLLLLAGATLASDNILPRRAAVVFGIVGAVLMTVSYAAVLVVASIATVFLIAAPRERRATNIARSIPLLLWSSCAIAIAIYGWSRSEGIRTSFGSGTSIVDSSDSAAESLRALVYQANVLGTGLLGSIGFLQDSPWNQLFKIAAFGFVVGVISLARARPLHLLLLIAPIGLALFAWSIGQYPLVPRTTLFLVPIVILLLAQGFEATTKGVFSPWKLLGAVLVLSILIGPIWTASRGIAQSRTKEEIRPVLTYIQARSLPGDALYVHYGAQYALLYYDQCSCFDGRGPLDGRWHFSGRFGREQFAPALADLSPDIFVSPYAGGDFGRQLADLQRLPDGTRVWFLYTHVAGAAEEMFIRRRLLGRLEEIGKRIAGIDRQGAHAYLYET